MNFKVLSFVLFIFLLISSCTSDRDESNANNLDPVVFVESTDLNKSIRHVPKDACGSSITQVGLGEPGDPGFPGAPVFQSSCCDVHFHSCPFDTGDTESVYIDACLGGPEYNGKSYLVRLLTSLDGGPFNPFQLSECRNVETNYCAHVEPFKITTGDMEDILCFGNPDIDDGEPHTWCFKAYLRIFSEPDCGGSFQDIVACGESTYCYTVH